MKKILAVLFIAAMAVLTLPSCDGGGDTALKWKNNASSVDDIQWMSEGSADQTWSGTTDSGETTDSKTVSKTTGSGEALLDGSPAVLNVGNGPGGSVTLSDGSDNTLTISDVSKK